MTDKQINKLSVYKEEFIDANFYDGLLGECIGEQYHDTFNRIIPKLKDPKEVVRFVMVEEIFGEVGFFYQKSLKKSIRTR